MIKIQNKNGHSAEIINPGATIFSINVPDKRGNVENVALGYDDPEEYKNNPVYFGTTAGRYGNRIAGGKFTLDGKTYNLTINNGDNHLHGGIKGLDQLIWKVLFTRPDSVKLSCKSTAGDQGYPGNIELTVEYTITPQNGIRIEFEGTTDAPTILNPTNHSYFNLSGAVEDSILDHLVYIDADKFTPTDKNMIPNGELRSVDKTPMDFRNPKAVQKDISADYEPLQFGNGFDHNWVLNNFNGAVRRVASVYDLKSGRFMEVYTDQPGIQFYSGNYLQGIRGKKGIVYKNRSGLCLETQCFPDSPNKAHFPSTILRPGEKYRHITEYRFSNK